jgi:hypothetical protein
MSLRFAFTGRACRKLGPATAPRPWRRWATSTRPRTSCTPSANPSRRSPPRSAALLVSSAESSDGPAYWANSANLLTKRQRPQRDSNPRNSLERAGSWAGLDDGDRRSAAGTYRPRSADASPHAHSSRTAPRSATPRPVATPSPPSTIATRAITPSIRSRFPSGVSIGVNRGGPPRNRLEALRASSGFPFQHGPEVPQALATLLTPAAGPPGPLVILVASTRFGHTLGTRVKLAPPFDRVCHLGTIGVFAPNECEAVTVSAL